MSGEPGGEPARVVEWGWAGAGLEPDSGDLHVVVEFEGGALVAAIDGLGHGVEAGEASLAAARVLAAFPGEPLVRLFERCHEALHKTRGAVMTLASFDAWGSRLTWTGVGNVEAFLLRADPLAQPPREVVSLRGGILGFQLPALRPSVTHVSRGDTLVLATDGIHSGFAERLPLHAGPQEIAESVLARHARGNDDALVVVARYLGEGP